MGGRGAEEDLRLPTAVGSAAYGRRQTQALRPQVDAGGPRHTRARAQRSEPTTSNPLLRGGGVLRGVQPGFGHYSTPERCYSNAALLRGSSPSCMFGLQW